MRNLLVALLMTAFSQFSAATVGPALIEELPQATIPKLEAGIKALVEKQTEFPLKDFKVAWDEVQSCQEVTSEMHDLKLMGTCPVKFSAFQVSGQAVVIVKAVGYGVSILYVDVE